MHSVSSSKLRATRFFIGKNVTAAISSSQARKRVAKTSTKSRKSSGCLCISSWKALRPKKLRSHAVSAIAEADRGLPSIIERSPTIEPGPRIASMRSFASADLKANFQRSLFDAIAAIAFVFHVEKNLIRFEVTETAVCSNWADSSGGRLDQVESADVFTGPPRKLRRRPPRSSC